MFAALFKGSTRVLVWFLVVLLACSSAPNGAWAVESATLSDETLVEAVLEDSLLETENREEGFEGGDENVEVEQSEEAHGTSQSSDVQDEAAEDEEPVSASGRLGSYYPWTLEGGVLTISSPTISSSSPYVLKYFDSIGYLDEAYRDHIVTARIQGPLATSVGGLFSGLSNLKSVEGLRYVQLRSYIDTKTGKRIQPMADSLFSGCASLEAVDLEDLSTDAVVSMDGVFQGCSSLKSLDVSGLETGSVRSMAYFFADCSSLEEVDLRTFDISNVIWGTYVNGSETCNAYGLGWMFQGCTSLRRVDMSGLTLPSTSYFHALFDGCASLEEVSLFSFTATEATPEGAVGFMFSGCVSLKSVDLSMLDTGVLTRGAEDIYFKTLFYGCPALGKVTVGPSSILQLALPGELWENASGVRFIPAEIPVDEAGVYTRVWPSEVTVSIRPLGASFLAVGTSCQLEADVDPTDRATDLTWSSSDEAVATVDDVGMLTAQAPGRATITASVGDASDSLHVEVRLCVRSVKMAEAAKTVKLRDGSFTLDAAVDPPDAYNATLGWSSTDSAVATVDAVGKVTPHAEGSTVITASAGGFSDSCTLTVEDPVTITFAEPEKVLLAGSAAHELLYTIEPVSAAETPLVWKTSDAGVVTVDQRGRVTPVRPGEATITVTCAGASAQCRIQVIESPDDTIEVASLALDRSRLELAGAQAQQLKATILPENATYKTVVWSSSDPSVADVDVTGLVTAIGKGTAFVRATSGDGAQSATCEVVVSNPVTTLEVTPSTKTVQVGDAFNVGLRASGELPGAVDGLEAPRWRVSNEEVLEVTSSGDVAQIRAKGVGSADVTVAAGKLQATCAVVVKEQATNVPGDVGGADVPQPPVEKPEEKPSDVSGGVSGESSSGTPSDAFGEASLGDSLRGSSLASGEGRIRGGENASQQLAVTQSDPKDTGVVLAQTGDENLAPLWLLLAAAFAATAACNLLARKLASAGKVED